MEQPVCGGVLEVEELTGASSVEWWGLWMELLASCLGVAWCLPTQRPGRTSTRPGWTTRAAWRYGRAEAGRGGDSCRRERSSGAQA
jgi:hypothetical protein